MEQNRVRKPAPSEQAILDRVEVILLREYEVQLACYDALMEAHHYLRNSELVSERLRYVAVFDGEWLALLSWSAAAYHLKDRDAWVGWNESQRWRRLALLANNSRFAILPGLDCPNLATRVFALNLARSSTDWESAYGHPILAVESFVDGQLFRGTCYRAQDFGRHAEDYYTAHERPKQLWVRGWGPMRGRAARRPPPPPARWPPASMPDAESHRPACAIIPAPLPPSLDGRGTRSRRNTRRGRAPSATRPCE